MNLTFADRVLDYLFHGMPSLPPNKEGISLLNPFSDPETQRVTAEFYKKFYNDNNPRTALIGINPGRFGGGITGIPFTDPVALEEACGIASLFQKKRELSSRFVYRLIHELGGTTRFYSRYYFATMYPLALIKGSKNFNYYDSPELYQKLHSDIRHNLIKQAGFGLERSRAICLGKKNFDHLNEINDKIQLFNEIEWIEHPRYIQQYKLKHIDEYILKYRRMLKD